MKSGLSEFEPYLDFWLEGQKKGFAGNLPREKAPDGSKFVILRNGNLLYVDRWYGSDLGGGQTILYKLDITEDPEKVILGTPISGKPIARLGYSGQIVRRFSVKEKEILARTFRDIPQSDIIWKVLKSSLSQVNRERPFRGPDYFEYAGDFVYESNEEKLISGIDGKERIYHLGRPVFVGSYDFTLIKNNLEDRL